MNLPVHIIIVSQGHATTLSRTLESLAEQAGLPALTYVVECGASEGPFPAMPSVTLLQPGGNLGFTGGNNFAWDLARGREGLVLFLNPDVVIPPDLLRQLKELSLSDAARSFGALTVRLGRWDFSGNRQLPGIDSTGVFPRLRGWADRREGSPPEGDYVEKVPAICGAFLFGRIDVFRSVERSPGELWDNRYFAYKEDIELSLRMRRAGHKLGIWHGATAYHGRGWNADRRRVSRFARLLSARNEVRLDSEYMPHRLPISLSKWLAVKFFNL